MVAQVPASFLGGRKKKKKSEENKTDIPERFQEDPSRSKPGTFVAKGFKDIPEGRDSGIIKGGAIPLGNRLVFERDPSQIQEIRAKEGVGLQQQQAENVLLPTQQEQLTRTLEQAGAFEDVTPKEQSLAPREIFGGDIPILGASTSAIVSVFGEENIIKEYGDIPITDGSVREMALAEIKMNAIKEGTSLSEKIGALVESIIVAGPLVDSYARGMIETPNENVKTIVAEISLVKEAASNGQEKVRNGLEDPFYGLGRAREMEEDIAALEGRIQLLINASSILRADADEVNRIQEHILIAKEKVSRYKKASELGLTAQSSGTGRIIPTDEQLYMELKSSIKRR